MFKRLSIYAAYLLLILLPLQSLAAANMSVCRSMMQTESTQQKTTMPHCNMHMADAKQDTKNTPQQHDCCKGSCASLCASLCAITVLPSDLRLTSLATASQKIFNYQILYTSTTLSGLQRPPIFLS